MLKNLTSPPSVLPCPEGHCHQAISNCTQEPNLHANDFSTRRATQFHTKTFRMPTVSFRTCLQAEPARKQETQKTEILNDLVFQKYGYPQIIHFNRLFHYKPSILGETPLFLETPISKMTLGTPLDFSENHIRKNLQGFYPGGAPP